MYRFTAPVPPPVTSGLSTSRALPRRSGHASPPASACQTASPVLRAGPNQVLVPRASELMDGGDRYARPPALPPRVRYGARGGGGCGRGCCDIGTVGLLQKLRLAPVR